MKVPSDGNATARTCARCGNNPAAGKHQWCNQCKAAYQRDYQKTQMEMAEKRAFLRGVAAQRDLLIDQFQRRGSAMVLCFEVALWLKDKAPRAEYVRTAPAAGDQNQDTETASVPAAP